METTDSKQYVLLPKDCLKYIHDFEELYHALTHCKAFKYDSIPKKVFDDGCVYVFYENNQIIYVGRSGKSLETSIKKQFSDNKNNLLAWKIFFDRYKEAFSLCAERDLKSPKIRKTYEYQAVVDRIKEEIKNFDIKAVKVRSIDNTDFDVTKEALFEIFVQIRSKSKYTDFEIE